MKKKYSILLLMALLFSARAFAQDNTIESGVELYFNGSPSNYVDFGDAFNSLQFPFTFETWINLADYPSGPFSGIFSTDNSSTSVYYGIWFTVMHSGQVRIEFGDGVGTGSSDRRGVLTNDALPLFQWVHLAFVCTSVSDIKIYFNGVDMDTQPTDGGSDLTAVTHSGNPAYLGLKVTVFDSESINARMDEMRLWNIARSENDLRAAMCHTLAGNETGLVGYWKVDESYTSNVLMDYSPSGTNGTLIKAVVRNNSKAPLGNSSVFLYPPDWNERKLTINSLTGDNLSVSAVGNNPYGVQIYRVDTIPLTTTGLNVYPHYFFGVFTVNRAAVHATYSVAYNYSFDDGIATAGNQNSLELFARHFGPASYWQKQSVTREQGRQMIVNDESNRHAFILNLNSCDKKVTGLSAEPISDCSITTYPNPFVNSFSLKLGGNRVDRISVYDSKGKEVYTCLPETKTEYSVNTQSWPNGIYFIRAANGSSSEVSKIVLSR